MMKDDLFNAKGFCDGKERELVEINADNIDELRSRIQNTSKYGEDVEIGNYAYFDGCGLDYYFVVVSPDRVVLS